MFKKIKTKIFRKCLWANDKKSQEIITGLWKDYINWEIRRRGENNWLVGQLKKYRCRNVFESALGDGCDAIFLMGGGI